MKCEILVNGSWLCGSRKTKGREKAEHFVRLDLDAMKFKMQHPVHGGEMSTFKFPLNRDASVSLAKKILNEYSPESLSE